MSVASSHLTELLADANTIAVVGLTDDPNAASYAVGSYIQSQGYDLIPVNPHIRTSLGQKAVPTLWDVKQPVDIVDVITNQVPLDEIGRAAQTLGAQAIWLQPGVAPQGAPAQLSGILVIYGKCLMREHRQLLSGAQL